MHNSGFISETEQVPGVLNERGERTIKVAPWHHMSFAFVIMAISRAYKEKLLSPVAFRFALIKISKFFEDNVRVEYNHAYMEIGDLGPLNHPKKGNLIFPTMYLIWCLGSLLDVL